MVSFCFFPSFPKSTIMCVTSGEILYSIWSIENSEE
uniref:WD_REPEATS_REGION domain-containing protein n=1 Tax=Heterorhabditis bacteriophora TaxID=37862 RepID=A0A1I7WH19_HETBA